MKNRHLFFNKNYTKKNAQISERFKFYTSKKIKHSLQQQLSLKPNQQQTSQSDFRCTYDLL